MLKKYPALDDQIFKDGFIKKSGKHKVHVGAESISALSCGQTKRDFQYSLAVYMKTAQPCVNIKRMIGEYKP